MKGRKSRNRSIRINETAVPLLTCHVVKADENTLSASGLPYAGDRRSGQGASTIRCIAKERAGRGKSNHNVCRDPVETPAKAARAPNTG